MERQKYRSGMLALLVAMHIAGLIGLQFIETRSLFISLTPFNLVVTFVISAYHFNWKNNRFILLSLLVFLLSFFIEVIGVKSGIIFGNYRYGDALGVKVFDVPVLIGLNWLMLIYATGSFAEYFFKDIYIKAFFGAGLMVLLDAFIEPVASVYDFWHWQSGEIPARNFLAWFLISAGFLYSFYWFGFSLKNFLARAVYVVQLMFFVVLYLLNVF